MDAMKRIIAAYEDCTPSNHEEFICIVGKIIDDYTNKKGEECGIMSRIEDKECGEDVVIFDDDPRAAVERDAKVWVSYKGRVFSSELAARYDGSTHKRCECGGIAKKPWGRCEKCRSKARSEMYATLPFKTWDGKAPLCLYRDSVFFHDEGEVGDYCEDQSVEVESLELVICEPSKLPVLDGEFFDGVLPEVGDLPPELQKAIDDFNVAVAAYKTPLSWEPGKFRTSI